jgi:hypothetical protein
MRHSGHRDRVAHASVTPISFGARLSNDPEQEKWP